MAVSVGGEEQEDWGEKAGQPCEGTEVCSELQTEGVG